MQYQTTSVVCLGGNRKASLFPSTANTNKKSCEMNIIERVKRRQILHTYDTNAQTKMYMYMKLNLGLLYTCHTYFSPIQKHFQKWTILNAVNISYFSAVKTAVCQFGK
jgi:hypothetical protein